MTNNVSKTHQDHVLRMMWGEPYRQLWEVGSIENFKQAWLDCLECELFFEDLSPFEPLTQDPSGHHLAYKLGNLLCLEVSENNLRVLPLPNERNGRRGPR
jgi:hypothetical protein